MSKTVKKFPKNQDRFGEYEYSNPEYDKKKTQKRERKSKYYDEIDTYGFDSRYQFKASKYR